MRVLPILFNTEIVRAILDGRKTVTRRIVKPAHLRVLDSPYHKEHPEVKDITLINKLCEPPCQPGDILYVRETWQECEWGYLYRAWPQGLHQPGTYKGMSWQPSIHMPKEAARIWLKVTDVRVERLKDITEEQAMKEGFSGIRCRCGGTAYACTDCYNSGWIEPPFVGFMYTWNSTIKKADLDRYDWDANPFVWAIEFERCERPDENGPAGSPEWKDNFMQRFCKVN